MGTHWFFRDGKYISQRIRRYAAEFSTNSSLTNCKDNKINILSGYAESQVEMLVYNMKSVQLFGFILAGCVLKKWASLKVNNYEIWKLKLNIY